MAGSSDLLPGSACGDTNEVFKYLSASCERLMRGNAVAVMTVPPTKVSGILSEVPFLNTLIVKNLRPHCLIVDCQEQFNSLPKRITIKDNGIGISEKGAEIIINAVSHMMMHDLESHKVLSPQSVSKSGDSYWSNKENVSAASPVPSDDQVLVEVPSAYMKHVVGKGQRNIERISKESSSKVEVYKYKEGDTTKEAVRITGREVNCKKAVDMIHQVIKDQKAKSTQTRGTGSHGYNPDYNKDCTFYADGKCNRGTACPFKHPDGPTVPKLIKFD